MTALRWARQAAVRAVSALKQAVTGVDYPGLSWRTLRAFQRGSGCLTRCDEGHTYEIGCALGPSWHGVLADILFPLPPRVHEIDRAVRAELADALSEAVERGTALATRLTLDGELWLDERGNPVEVGTSWQEDLQAPVDTVLHLPSCASVEDAEGKSGPCDCGVSELDTVWVAPLTGPQRIRASLRLNGLPSTGGDSPDWALPPGWLDRLNGLQEAMQQGLIVGPGPVRPAGCQAQLCFGMECMTECSGSHRLTRYAETMTEQRRQEDERG